MIKQTLDNFLSEIESAFSFTLKDARGTIRNFHSEMNLGLEGKASSLKMLPSFAYRAGGKEAGRYLALDLGGSNLRVLAVDLSGNGNMKMVAVSKFVVSEKLMKGEGTALFDFIADSIHKFLVKNSISLNEKYNLAFTFSFPIDQKSIASGNLIVWTKEFSAAGVEGKDVARLLSDALKRKGLGLIKVVALANDTVGTLAAKSYANADCDMGVILGTGTNACYVEESKGGMIINIEWGNFSKLKLNLYDKMLDRASQNAGRQYLEKMVSGMYLGEISRMVIVDAISKRFISEELGAEFAEPYSFKTEQMSRIEIPSPPVGEGWGEGECALIKKICAIVSLRSARIAAAAIAAVITWMDKDLNRRHTVAIDGSLFEKYPEYKGNIQNLFSELFGKQSANINLEMAKDGSGIGAAVIASEFSS